MDYFWTDWSPIIHTLVLGTGGYLLLVLLLKSTGPRTMASMTPLDFVVAVTLGSAFGRTVTAEDVPLAQAAAALVLLVALQWALAVVRARSPRMRQLLDSAPVLLYYDGRMQDRSLRRHRLTEADVHGAARQSGMGSLEDAEAVVLHQNGSLGVISSGSLGDGSSLLPYVEGRP